jgi:hypothetical protein
MHNDIVFEHMQGPMFWDTVFKSRATARKMNQQLGNLEQDEVNSTILVSLGFLDHRRSHEGSLRYAIDAQGRLTAE